MIEAIAFDIGGVLAHDVWQNLVFDRVEGVISRYHFTGDRSDFFGVSSHVYVGDGCCWRARSPHDILVRRFSHIQAVWGTLKRLVKTKLPRALSSLPWRGGVERAEGISSTPSSPSRSRS